MDEKLKILEQYNPWGPNKPQLGYVRSLYVDKMMKFSGNNLAKVLVGQRRVGKSYVMRQVVASLIERGVKPENIFILNKEFEDFGFVESNKDLNDLFKAYLTALKPRGKVYVFVDEVQNITSWEKFVNSVSQDYRQQYEVFITGSNSKMLSGELATLLSGRYIEMEVLPFSYDEYLGYYNKAAGCESYSDYLHSSGLPEIYRLNDDETRRYYVNSLKDTIILRDIVSRYKVRDVSLLEDLFVYVTNNASNYMSVTNIRNYLKGMGRTISYETAAAYLQYLEDTFLIFRVNRYNIRGKSVIGGNAKYYTNDMAFHNYLYRGFGYGEGYLLENAVYLELRRMGFDIYVGNFDEKEVDFVCVKGDRRLYVQVAYDLSTEETARREYASLESINDSYEKYVVSMNSHTLPINQGIRHVRAWELKKVLENNN